MKKRSLVSDSELNEIFESKSLKELKKKRLEQMSMKAKELLKNLENIVLENVEFLEDEEVNESDEDVVKPPRSSEEKLICFLEDICENYESQKEVKFNYLLDDALFYISRLLRKNHSFDVFSAYDSKEREILPANLIGIKHRGYFHQIMLIKVIVSEQDTELSLNSWDKRELRILGNFVKKRFLQFEFYENIHQNPVVFTIGYALVKKSSNKHFLKDANLIEVYYSNVPKEKEARIKELVSENHAIKNT